MVYVYNSTIKSTPWNNILYNRYNLNVITELLVSTKFIFSNLRMYQLSLVVPLM